MELFIVLSLLAIGLVFVGFQVYAMLESIDMSLKRIANKCDPPAPYKPRTIEDDMRAHRVEIDNAQRKK